MVKEIIIPKENKAQVVEIRYLENQETSRFNKVLKPILSTTYCMPNEWKVGSGPSFRTEIKTGLNSTGVNVKAGVDLVKFYSKGGN